MKVKIVSVLIVILLMMMCVPVFADTQIPDPPDSVSEWEYWVIVQGTNNYIYLIVSDNPVTVTTEEDQLVMSWYVKYVYKENEWQFKENNYEGKYYFSFENIYKSNHDIAYEDGSGFFFVVPKVPRIYPIVKMMDFGNVLRSFSAGLIPIVGVVVLSVGFRKAWGFLQSQLTR